MTAGPSPECSPRSAAQRWILTVLERGPATEATIMQDPGAAPWNATRVRRALAALVARGIVIGLRSGSRPVAWAIAGDDRDVVPSPPPARSGRLGVRQHAVLDVLDDWGALGERDIADETKIQPTDVARTLAALYARGLVYQLADGRWYQGQRDIVAGPERAKGRPPRWPVEKAVYAYLEAHPGAPARQVTRDVPASHGSVREAIDRLQARGWVVRAGEHVWTTP